jgi:Ca2+-binding EF-hand superfamily protein
VVSKLSKVEKLIKDKLSANWVSVRKAFLDLDLDYDGYVTVDDILRVLGEEGRRLDFNDLTKLILDKDHKRRGRINYTDFSKWLGGVI